MRRHKKQKRGVSSGYALFVKINTLLVMIDYKSMHFALIGDKSSKGAYEDVILKSSQSLSKMEYWFYAHVLYINNPSDL